MVRATFPFTCFFDFSSGRSCQFTNLLSTRNLLYYSYAVSWTFKFLLFLFVSVILLWKIDCFATNCVCYQLDSTQKFIHFSRRAVIMKTIVFRLVLNWALSERLCLCGVHTVLYYWGGLEVSFHSFYSRFCCISKFWSWWIRKSVQVGVVVVVMIRISF